MGNRVALLGLSLLGSLLLVELGCFVLASTNVLQMPVPRYTLGGPSLKTRQPFWADLNPHFGVWHRPSATLRHRKSCFDVQYRSNSHGLRDPERGEDSTRPRVVVLGDSMIEGFGIPRGQRMTDLLEARTGTEFLNFGTSGDFGTTQYYLLYKHLAKDFRHDAVIVGLLPHNDFRDDDIEFGRTAYPDRYRPYWIREGDDWKLTYFKASLEERGPPPQRRVGLEPILREFTYTYNAMRYAKRLLQQGEQRQFFSLFYDYDQTQLERMLHSLRLLIDEAGDRPVVLVLLPAEHDLRRNAGAGSSPLVQALERFARERGATVVDLVSAMARHSDDWSAYYHECDPHWNARGNRVAAALVLDAVRETMPFLGEGAVPDGPPPD